MRTAARTLEEKIADRGAKLDALHAKLTGAVEALVTGEDCRHAMEFAARFRARSFNNTLLIWVQHTAAYAKGRVPDPYPTFVAGFKQWQTLGRHVMKGQTGNQIFSPSQRAWRPTDPRTRPVGAAWARRRPRHRRPSNRARPPSHPGRHTDCRADHRRPAHAPHATIEGPSL